MLHAPPGNLMKLFQAIAGGPGAIATTGLAPLPIPQRRAVRSTNGAKDTGREVVSPHRAGGRECLFYPAFPLDVCFLRATYGGRGRQPLHPQ